jgi:hypothetical protein
MSCLAVLFSLDEGEVNKLKSFSSDTDRLNYLQMEIEEKYFSEFPERVAELDKSWDALHRTLTDGKLEWRNGTFPLNHVILGGELLYRKDNYIMSLKIPLQVEEIAKAIESVAYDSFKADYYKIDKADYGFEPDEDDLEYTWTWFQASKEFWELAARERRYVLFTVDQ